MDALVRERGRGWPEAIIFDLDGTLIDSAPDLAAALNVVIEERGLEPVPVNAVRMMIGAGVRKLIERGFRFRGVSLSGDGADTLVPRFLDYYDVHATDLTTLYDGAADLLKALSGTGIKIGLCTNKPTEVTRIILRDLGVLDYFGAVIGGSSGFPRKPDPASLLACVKELDTTSGYALYVGDSETDVATARNAHIPFVVVAGGYTATPAGELGGDAVVANLAGVARAIVGIKSTA